MNRYFIANLYCGLYSVLLELKVREIIMKREVMKEGVSPESAFEIQEIDGNKLYIDLRTLVDISVLGVESNEDFSDINLSAIHRLYRYQKSNLHGFDMDNCKTSRRKYSFILIDEVYEKLWGNVDGVDSSETLISPNRNIAKICPDLRIRKPGRAMVDWDMFSKIENYDLEILAHNIATLGNYMPVPAKEQLVLNRYFDERFDLFLVEIKRYYEQKIMHKSFSGEIINWLNIYTLNEKDGFDAWKNFVDRNYLKDSFVNEKYEVISYDGTVFQLALMIASRTQIMHQAYENVTL